MTMHSRLLLIAFMVASSTGSWCAPVNVNSADAATLAQELKGIGGVKAQAIVDYRQKHGAFRTIDELAQVKGISQKLIDRNRTSLRLNGVAGSAAQLTVLAPSRAAVKPAPHKKPR